MSWNILSKTNLQYLLTRLKEVIPKISANPQTTTDTLNSIEIDGTAYDIQGSGEPNVQSDWNETDNTSDAYIQNKPTVTAPGDIVQAGAWWYVGDTEKDVDTAEANMTHFVYESAHNAPDTGPFINLSDKTYPGKYAMQLMAGYNTDGLYFRKKNGDTNTWGSWRAIDPQYRYTTNGTTTKLKIRINCTKTWMLCFTITLYQGYRASKIMISGYNYGANHWHQPEAVLLGDSDGNTSIPVYFGYNSDYNLWVGFDGGQYTGIHISDVSIGYVQLSAKDIQSLFVITNESALNTLQSTVTATNTVNNSGHLNGYASSDSATGNTIARRNPNGYIFATYFNGSSSAENINSFTSYPLFASSDGYFRKATKASFSTYLGLDGVTKNAYTTGSAVGTTVQHGTETVVAHITTIAAGTYIFLGMYNWSTSFETICNTSIQVGTGIKNNVRGSAHNGGGQTCFLLATISANTAIKLIAYQDSGSAKTISSTSLVAIRLY